MSQLLTSGDLARATGETVRTVRFYEEQGLLRPSGLSEGGHRRYDQAGLEQLQLILDLREVGLSIPDIRGLLAVREGCRTAVDFRRVLAERLPDQLARTRARIERMRRLEAELRQALASVADEPGVPAAEVPCPCTVASESGAPRIVRVLARNGSCASPHARLAGKAGPVVGGDSAGRSHA